jgi:hypothetical protein
MDAIVNAAVYSEGRRVANLELNGIDGVLATTGSIRVGRPA